MQLVSEPWMEPACWWGRAAALLVAPQRSSFPNLFKKKGNYYYYYYYEAQMECFVCLWLALWFFICSFFPSRIPTLITPKSCRVATPAQRLINALLVVASSSSSSRHFRPRLCWCWIRKKRAETRPKKNTKIQSGDTFLHCWGIRNSPLSIRVWPPPFSRRSHLQSAVMALLMLGQWHAQLFPFLFLFSGLLFPYMRPWWESHEQWKARAIFIKRIVFRKNGMSHHTCFHEVSKTPRPHTQQNMQSKRAGGLK
jgi:hypothetical protein